MDAPANKMQTSETTKRAFFYPDHGVTIEASSQQEADEALAKKLDSATIKS